MDRETLVDAIVVVVFLVYGVLVVGDTPFMALAAWLVGALIALRHAVEPFDERVEENQLLFILVLIAILLVGMLLS